MCQDECRSLKRITIGFFLWQLQASIRAVKRTFLYRRMEVMVFSEAFKALYYERIKRVGFAKYISQKASRLRG